jgi:hypothetical protein
VTVGEPEGRIAQAADDRLEVRGGWAKTEPGVRFGSVAQARHELAGAGVDCGYDGGIEAAVEPGLLRGCTGDGESAGAL